MMTSADADADDAAPTLDRQFKMSVCDPEAIATVAHASNSGADDDDDAAYPEVCTSEAPLRDDHVTTAAGFEPRLQQVRLGVGLLLSAAGRTTTEPLAYPSTYTDLGGTTHIQTRHK